MLVLWDDENQSYTRDNNGVKLNVIVLYDWFGSIWENMPLLFLSKSFNGNSNRDETKDSSIEVQKGRACRHIACPTRHMASWTWFTLLAIWWVGCCPSYSPYGEFDMARTTCHMASWTRFILLDVWRVGHGSSILAIWRVGQSSSYSPYGEFDMSCPTRRWFSGKRGEF